jgi:thiol-disulfide isomerase/thioredoxin
MKAREDEEDKGKFKARIHRTDKDFSIQKDGRVFLKDSQGCSGFIALYAPWCGYCKDTAPVWNRWADQFEGTSFMFLAVDCTDEAHAGKVAAALQIHSYPTVKFIDRRTQEILSTDNPDGSKLARTQEGLGAFLKKQGLVT